MKQHPKMHNLIILLSLGSTTALAGCLAGWMTEDDSASNEASNESAVLVETKSNANTTVVASESKSHTEPAGNTESSPAVIQTIPVLDDTGEAPAVVVGDADLEIDPETGFALAAFPPTIPDRDWHKEAWTLDNCLDCHETGVQDAPMIRHMGLPDITWESKCRSCHVLIPGNTDYTQKVEDSPFASWAFPPMMPNNDNHDQAWGNNNCMMCHEDGARDAPKLVHEGMPRIMLKAKCRSCHVQVRSHMSSPFEVIDLDE